MAGKWYAEKVGPLPVGAWIGVVAGGVGIGLYLRHREANKTPTVSSDEEGLALDEPGLTAGPIPTVGGSAGSTGGGAGGTGTTAPDSSAPTTNQQWAIYAIRWLISEGWNPTTSDTAIRKWLAGYKITAAENAVVQAALVQFGPPPEDVPLPVIDDNPAPVDQTPSTPSYPIPTVPVVTPPSTPPQNTVNDGQNVAVVTQPPATTPPAAPVASGCSAVSPGPDPRFGILQRGSRGDWVARVQQGCAQHGHDVGPWDGIFGERTEAGVRAVQAEAGLQVDGKVGAQTACALGI